MKKLISIILSILMLVSLVPVVISAVAGDVAEGYSPATGSTPITSASDITDPSGSYHLTKDIVWGDMIDDAEFTGTIDGCGYSITVSNPMFAVFNGTIKNVKLNGTISFTDGSHAAAVAIESTTKMTASNVTSDVDITTICDSASRTATGLYAAAIVCTSETTNFTNVVNTGDITVKLQYYAENGDKTEKPRAAGLVAISNTSTFNNCTNYGKITCEGYKSISAGICARIALNKTATKVQCDHCINNGEIVTKGEGSEAGGVVGYAGASGHSLIYYLFGCVNTGNVSAEKGSGGIIGYITGNSQQFGELEHCINTGNITVGTNYASPWLGYSNTAKTQLGFNIDIGSLTKSNDDYKTAFLGFSKTQPNTERFISNHMVNRNKFEYLVYTSTADQAEKNILMSAVKDTEIAEVSLDYLNSKDYIDAINAVADANSSSYISPFRYIAGQILPVLTEKSTWTYSDGKYTYNPSEIFSIKVMANTATLNKTVAEPGETIVVTPIVPDGQVCDYIKISIDDGRNWTKITGNSFVMPAGSVRVRAYFADKMATVIDKNGNTIADFANMDLAITYAEANEGSTIKLLDNITASQLKIDQGDFTIDLNGFIVEHVEHNKYSIFTVSNGANVTFTDTSADSNGMVKSHVNVIRVTTGASVTINAGKYVGEKYSVYSDDAVSSVIINGGTFGCDTADAAIELNGKFEINGGVFNPGTKYNAILKPSGNCEINGGEFVLGTADTYLGVINYNIPDDESSTLDMSDYDGVTKIGDITVYANSGKAPILPEHYTFINDGVEYSAFTKAATYTIGLKTYKITVTSGANGTLTASSAQSAYGESVTLTVDAAEGYVLDTLLVNGTDVAGSVVSGTYTFTMPAADVTIAASFREKAADDLYVAMRDEDTNELLSGIYKLSDDDGDGVYTATIYATVTKELWAAMDIVDENGVIDNSYLGCSIWVEDYGYSPVILEIHYSYDTKNSISSSWFGPYSNLIVINETENGTITVDKNMLNNGETFTVTATPNEGYVLTYLDIYGCEITEVIPGEKYEVAIPEDWHRAIVEIDAMFEFVPTYSVTISAEEGGVVTTSKQSYYEGETVDVVITEKKGYMLESVEIYADGEIISRDTSFEMPDCDVEIVVTFEQVMPSFVKYTLNASVALEGAELEKGDFMFQLSYLYNGEEIVIQTLKNDANGELNFAPIHSSTPYNYTFFIKQIALDDAGVEYDATVYEISVKVAYGKDGKLVATIYQNNVEFVNSIK